MSNKQQPAQPLTASEAMIAKKEAEIKRMEEEKKRRQEEEEERIRQEEEDELRRFEEEQQRLKEEEDERERQRLYALEMAPKPKGTSMSSIQSSLPDPEQLNLRMKKKVPVSNAQNPQIDKLYVDDEGFVQFPDGSRFRGPLKNGNPEGVGIIIYADGS